MLCCLHKSFYKRCPKNYVFAKHKKSNDIDNPGIQVVFFFFFSIIEKYYRLCLKYPLFSDIPAYLTFCYKIYFIVISVHDVHKSRL